MCSIFFGSKEEVTTLSSFLPLSKVKEKIMDDYTVPILIQGKLGDRANAFSEQLQDGYRYFPDARGKFIYLARMKPGDNFYERVGRLTYEGDTENMKFVIFDFSSGKYDPKIQNFPGSQYLDGTIEGALKALTTAYPARKRPRGAKTVH